MTSWEAHLAQGVKFQYSKDSTAAQKQMENSLHLFINGTAQREIEKASQDCPNMPQSFQRLHSKFIEVKRRDTQYWMGIKTMLCFMFLTFNLCTSCNVCFLYLILDSFNLIAELNGIKLSVTVKVSLTISELLSAAIESKQDPFWKEYQDLASIVTQALGINANQVPARSLPFCVERLERNNRDQNDEILALFRSLRQTKCFECTVCACWKDKQERVQCEHWNPWKQKHECCGECLKTWASEPGQLEKMIRSKSLTANCFFDEAGVRCSGTFSEDVLSKLETCRHIGRVTCSCSGVAKLARDLKRRRFFVKNAGWKRYFCGNVVECPHAACVGCGYGETGIAMCFLCEHQWQLTPSVSPDSQLSGLPPECKRCPSCRAAIQKDGGCDHMTCRCGYEFWWSSGLKYERWRVW